MHYDAQAVAQIRPTKEQIEDELLAKEGVVGVDIGEKISDDGPTGEISIIVFVEKKKAASRIRKADMVPPEVDGIKTDVQEMEIELQHGSEVPLAGLQVDPGTYDPLVGGISMGPQRLNGSGTLGALVRDRTNNRVAALTNWHVGYADAAGAPGDVMVQPGRLDGGTTPFATLTRGAVTEFIDAAVVTLDQGRAWDDTITQVGTIAGTAPASNGMAVQKRGRTTEHTTGTVASVDATVTLTYPGLGQRTLRRQIRIVVSGSHPRFSDRGDSGSVVMTTDRRVVGLLFAGAIDGSATFANPIGDVLTAMDVEFNPTQVRPVPTLLVADCGGPVLSKLICPSSPQLCPKSTVIICQEISRITCPSVVGCPTTLGCPSLVTVCVSSVQCPTQLGCPSTLACPSLVGCPSQVICGPPDLRPNLPMPGHQATNPYGGGGYGAAGWAQQGTNDYWAGYLAAMEQVATELQAADQAPETEQ